MNRHDVRPARDSDVPALMAMGREFHASAYSRFGTLDEGSAEKLLRSLIVSPRGLVLTNGVGAIGGLISPAWFQRDSAVMEEAFWWATGRGDDLLRTFISTSRDMGATSIMLSTLENDRSEVVARLLRRFGFTPIERRFTLSLA